MRRRDTTFPDNGFEAWGGYMQAKIAKLEEQFSSDAGKNNVQVSNVLGGVSIFVNGYTSPSADELKALMLKHGGVYHTYQRSDDFIIASNLPDTKVKNMSLARVVRPEWITDSIEAKKVLDYRDYLLYGSSKTQPKLNFCKTAGKTNTDIKPLSFGDLNYDSKTADLLNEGKVNNISIITPNLVEIQTTQDGLVNKAAIKLTEPISSTKTAADPNFISEFYNNSRLHHISQLGACFKQYINDVRESNDFSFPARNDLKNRIITPCISNSLFQTKFEDDKIIMHIDMDCFFVSVGLRKRPDLLGKPVAVTHSKGGQPKSKREGVDRRAEFTLYKHKQAKKLNKANGILDEETWDHAMETRVDGISNEDEKYGSMSEIASCSYEARAKGLRNGMFMGNALRLCPELQTIPYDFEGYKEVAYTLYNTVAQYTLDIEAVSCDEMYVDCTEVLKSLNITVQDFATALREEIKIKTGCPCSAGFGGNRLQARLATKRAKPDGQFFLFADLVKDFMFDIKLKDLPGVGRQTAQKLEALGHDSCGSFQSLLLPTIQKHLGTKTGTQLYNQCRGRDPHALSFHTVRKSVSAEVNYGIRFESNSQCETFLKQLAEEVHSRMKQFKVTGKCITLKLMVRAEEAPVETAKFMGHGFCDVINKSVTLNNATNDADIITKEVISICKKQKIDPKEMRGIGIQVTKLEAITTKQTIGALNKFLLTKKTDIQENDHSTNNLINVDNAYEASDDSIKKEVSTPKKSTPFRSPMKKKSPIIGIAKSPLRRRGRPPKNFSMRAQSTSKNLISKFLLGQCRDDHLIQVKNEKPSNLPEFHPVVEEKTNREPETPSGFLGLSWQKVRELLRAWLNSCQPPLACDVDLITEYMREMVINKNIDKLYILVNFLLRRIRELDCEIWLQVFDKIMEQVQNAMVAVYGKKLYLDD